MEKIKYAVLPQFQVKKIGKHFDLTDIDARFNEWVKRYTDQGYVINRPATLLGIVEPGCFQKLILRKQSEYLGFASFELIQSDAALDYSYHLAPMFTMKCKKMTAADLSKIKKSPGLFGYVFFEKHRQDFEKYINEHINKISAGGRQYNSSINISVRYAPGCLGKLMFKKSDDADFTAYEFIKADKAPEYKCRVFPIYKAKSSKFSLDDFENHYSKLMTETVDEGYNFVGKIEFSALLKRGCFKGHLNLDVDAFIFEKA